MYYFQVSPFSKNYRTLRNAEDADFNECMQCKRFHMDESCSCNITDAAVRIEGFWTPWCQNFTSNKTVKPLG